MTDAAAFHLDGLVFKNPWASLIRVALKTGVIVPESELAPFS